MMGHCWCCIELPLWQVGDKWCRISLLYLNLGDAHFNSRLGYRNYSLEFPYLSSVPLLSLSDIPPPLRQDCFLPNTPSFIVTYRPTIRLNATGSALKQTTKKSGICLPCTYKYTCTNDLSNYFLVFLCFVSGSHVFTSTK